MTSIAIDKMGFRVATFGGEAANIRWKDVSKVVLKKRCIQILTASTKVKITTRLKGFPEVADVVRKLCEGNRINFVDLSQQDRLVPRLVIAGLGVTAVVLFLFLRRRLGPKAHK